MSPNSPEGRTAFEYVWRSPWVRAAVYSVIILLTLWWLGSNYGQYSFVLIVGLVGYLLAYLLNPLVVLLQRWRCPRGLAVVIVMLLLLGLLLLGSLLIAQVVMQLGEFVQRVPEAVEEAGSSIGGFTAWIGSISTSFQHFMAGPLGVESADELSALVRDQAAGMLANTASSFAQLLRNIVSGGTGVLIEGATSIISGTAQFVLILLASAYFLADYTRISANFYRIVPVRWRPVYSDLAVKADQTVGGYLRGQLLISGILGGVLWLGLAILGVPLALAIGFLAGIFNIVPYLGPIIGAIPAILLGLTISPLTALLVVILFVLANQLEGNLLSPLVLSKNVNVHPLTVLLAIMAGLSLFGLVGALLAVPAVALAKLVFEDYVLGSAAYHSGPHRHRHLRRGAAVEPVDAPVDQPLEKD